MFCTYEHRIVHLCNLNTGSPRTTFDSRSCRAWLSTELSTKAANPTFPWWWSIALKAWCSNPGTRSMPHRIERSSPSGDDEKADASP